MAKKKAAKMATVEEKQTRREALDDLHKKYGDSLTLQVRGSTIMRAAVKKIARSLGWSSSHYMRTAILEKLIPDLKASGEKDAAKLLEEYAEERVHGAWTEDDESILP